MNISRRWLEDFLRQPLEPRDVAERLAMLGAPVDAIEPLHQDLADVVVGLVEDVRPHPDADRLRLCQVNDGGTELRNVVCGAPNVTAGRRYPFARVGTTLPGGLKLERRKIRGQASEGMLCSERELGLGQDHEGIWELATDAAPGTPLLEALPLADDRFVVDVTPNRPDLLGHKGVARELAGSYGIPFRLPELPGADPLDLAPSRRAAEPSETGGVRIAIEDLDGCARFHAAVIRGVAVGPSPEWLKRRLESVGVRSISNVVDATNLGMLEHGQPMHAYDLARLAGPEIVVRRASGGEMLTTLDGVERKLAAGTVAICDANGVIGAGGVMGGAGTEVSAGTTDVILECAWFRPSRIRAGRTALGLSTDASHRFERGVDLWGAEEAFRRCIALIIATAGGRLDGEPLDLWPRVTHPPRIFLRLDQVAQVLGVELDQKTVEKQLVAIGATCVAKPEDRRIAVDVPGWRPDLQQEIDLIEEVARVFGYGSIPDDLRGFRVGSTPDAAEWTAVDRVRQRLLGLGVLEVVTLPLTAPDGPTAVRLQNPLSSEEGALRRRLLPSLARQAERNWAAHVRDVRLCELGTVFERVGEGAPRETQAVAAVLSGARAPGHWTGAAPDTDAWDIRGMLAAVVDVAAPGATIEPTDDGWIARDRDGNEIGRAGLLDADRPAWAAPLFGLEVAIDSRPSAVTRYRPLPVTPSSERDVTLLVPAGVSASAIREALGGAGVKVLESVAVVNEYRGPRVGADQRSLTFRLTFRAPDRTLEAAEVDRAETRLLEALERATGARRRDQSRTE